MPARALILSLLALTTLPSLAQEHRYDVFAKVIAPLVATLASDNDGSAFRADIQLVSATGLDPRFAGTRVSIALRMPDRLLITGGIGDDTVMLARDEQEVWAWPGGQARGVLTMIAPDLLNGEESSGGKLPDFQLPFPKKQLVFLPALFEVEDAGMENLAGVECRVLDVRLMPELAESAKATGWSVRLWVAENAKPAKIEIAHGTSRAVVTIREWTFPKQLPKETFAAPAGDEVLRLNAAQVEKLIEVALKKFR